MGGLPRVLLGPLFLQMKPPGERGPEPKGFTSELSKNFPLSLNSSLSDSGTGIKGHERFVNAKQSFA